MEEKQFDACMKRMKSGDKGALHEIYEAYLVFMPLYAKLYQTVRTRRMSPVSFL